MKCLTSADCEILRLVNRTKAEYERDMPKPKNPKTQIAFLCFWDCSIITLERSQKTKSQIWFTWTKFETQFGIWYIRGPKRPNHKKVPTPAPVFDMIENPRAPKKQITSLPHRK